MNCCTSSKTERGERIARYETVRVRKDGTRLDVSLTISPLTDEEGRVWGASTIARDITDRKRAEQALRDSEARHRAILEASVDAIITIDERGIIDSVNPATERLFGYSRRRIDRRQREHADALAAPRDARHVPRQLPAHGAAQDHRHRPRSDRPPQGRQPLSHGPFGQRDRASPGGECSWDWCTT